MGVEDVRWPPPPYRLSRVIGLTPILLMVLNASMALAGALLLVSTGFLILAPNGSPDSGSPIDRWLPIMVIFGIGAGLLWVAYRVFRSIQGRRQVAEGGHAGQIIDADVLFAKSVPRSAGAVWFYAYSQGGRRYFDRRVGTGDPLFLDDVETRGAVLVVDGGGELIFANFYPLRLDRAEREPARQDVARLAAAPTTTAGGSLQALEARSPPGAPRDYVRCFREAAAAVGRDRDKLIRKRHGAAQRLAPEAVDGLLRECRREVGRPAGGAHPPNPTVASVTAMD